MADIAVTRVEPARRGVLGVILRILRWIGAWLVAAVSTTVLGSVLQTQRVVGELNAVDGGIGLGERVSATFYDLNHFAVHYGAFILVGTLVAFLAGSLVYRLAGFGRPVVFAVAGAVAMAVMLTLMKEAFFGVQIVAGARFALGFALQIVAGGLGGLVFAWLSSRGRAAR